MGDRIYQQQDQNRLLNIVHISGDFPDCVEAFKTPVIRSLIDLTSNEFNHRVYSLNRRPLGLACYALQLARGFGYTRLEVLSTPFSYGSAITYFAPGRGVSHAAYLRKLGDWLADDLLQNGKPDLIVGHKLSIEGIVAKRSAERLGVPFSLSIQGNTDIKIMSARPDLRAEFGQIYHQAAMVFPFAPWALKRTEALLGCRQGPSRLLPCPTDLDTPLAPRSDGRDFISVFHLKNYQTKNLRNTARAMRILEQKGRCFELSIIGGGSDDDLGHCLKMTSGVQGVRYDGPLDRAPLRKCMQSAVGLVMPSLRESFGLVFIEALFAGLPIIYPAGTAVDGYFDDLPFALRVNANKPAEIAQAMEHMMSEQNAMKTALQNWQNSEHAKRFTRKQIAKQFAQGLKLSVN